MDLKVSILNNGIYVHDEVFSEFSKNHRLSANPYTCNTILLKDNIPVFMAKAHPDVPFHLRVLDGKPTITYNGEFVTEVNFPAYTGFYEQKTSNGVSFGDLAVIQGLDMLAFAYMWPCEFAKTGHQCGFCHTGSLTVQNLYENKWMAGWDNPTLPPEAIYSDLAEVVRYAVKQDPKAGIIQLTAGSTFNPDKEIDRYVNILKTIDKEVGINNVPVIIYLTPPSDIKLLDRLFDAGVSYVACDMDIWDESVFLKMCPGKANFTTRKKHLDVLLYIAEKYGPNKACSVFVAGLESAESLMEGQTFLAEHGIVPLPSPFMPFAASLQLLKELKPVGVDFYRTIRRETAMLYKKYGLVVPGTFGSDVCLSRDIWLRRDILAG